jgi:hypothetical protein
MYGRLLILVKWLHFGRMNKDTANVRNLKELMTRNSVKITSCMTHICIQTTYVQTVDIGTRWKIV